MKRTELSRDTDTSDVNILDRGTLYAKKRKVRAKSRSGVAVAVAAGLLVLAGCSAAPGSPASARALTEVQPAVVVKSDESAISPDQVENLGPLSAEDAEYSKNKNLTAESAHERQEEIDTNYSVGDVLAPEDAEFIRIAAAQTPQMQDAMDDTSGVSAVAASNIHAVPAATSSFSKSGSGAGGSGTVKGSHTMNYSDAPWNFNGSWSTKYTASGSSAVTKITAKEQVRMYGLVGSSGIGVVYAADPYGTVSGRTNAFSRSASFTAYGAYWTMNYNATFYTSKGSFNVTG